LFIRRSLLVLTAATVVLSFASPVLAHVDPDPEEAQAGSQLSVGFTVQHGCDGSPTVQLDMRLPEGVTGAQPEPPEGWTGTVESDVITFTGGPLPDDQELTFRVLMTLPPTPDTTIYFPFVQRCEVGEIRWIAIPSDGSGTELDEPAPAMRLTGPAVTTTTAAVTTTTAAPATTTAATTTAAPSTLASASTTGSNPTAPATSIASEDGRGSSAGTFVFIGVIAAIAAVASVLVVRSRGQRR
jgi:uncharacterized protein YcnI